MAPRKKIQTARMSTGGSAPLTEAQKRQREENSKRAEEIRMKIIEKRKKQEEKQKKEEMKKKEMEKKERRNMRARAAYHANKSQKLIEVSKVSVSRRKKASADAQAAQPKKSKKTQ